MRKWAKRLGSVAVAVLCLVAVGAIALSYGTRGDSGAALTASICGPVPAKAVESASQANTTLKVITLNVAHGRREGHHQALQGRSRIKANLDAIAQMLVRERPDVVAIQEADGPSIWSGDFDHVEHLARKAGFPHRCRGEHVRRMKLSYGTALLSRVPVNDCRSITFAPSPPTLTKGFVFGTIQWPGRSGLEVDVVSVHLDFSRKSVRQEQIEKLISELSQRDNPLIIMGDFNCEWTGKDGSLATLADELDVATFQPTAEGAATFPALKKRFDWLFVSPMLEFVEYRTLPDTLSDHRGVAAVLKIADREPASEP